MAWNDDLICRKSIDRLSFGPFQLVSNAQADMGQDLSQVHLAPFSQSVVLIFLNHLLLVLVDLVVFFLVHPRHRRHLHSYVATRDGPEVCRSRCKALRVLQMFWLKGA